MSPRLSLAALALAAACGPAARGTGPAAPLDYGFADPRCAQIRGWTGDAMEPYLTHDGRYLLFNSSNAPTAQTDIQVATVVDELTFDWVGPLAGANSPQLDGVPTVTTDGTLYFVSVRSYGTTGATVYRARFANGVADSVSLVDGFPTAPGLVHFDVEASADGGSLYYAAGIFDGGAVPKSADLAVAIRQGTSFAPSSSATAKLGGVNTANALEYAAAISQDGRELFFTRLVGTDAGIFHTTRGDAAGTFATPARIAAISGFVEGPTLSPDGQRLYYHQRVGDRFEVCRVRRVQTP